jgi:hypothetical protein
MKVWVKVLSTALGHNGKGVAEKGKRGGRKREKGWQKKDMAQCRRGEQTTVLALVFSIAPT